MQLRLGIIMQYIINYRVLEFCNVGHWHFDYITPSTNLLYIYAYTYRMCVYVCLCITPITYVKYI